MAAPVCMIASALASANADLIIEDARLINFGPDVMLITADLSGGLSVVITDLGEGIYQFGYGIAGDPYNLFSASPGLVFTPTQAADWHGVLGPTTSPQTFSVAEARYYAYWEEVPRFGAGDTPDSGDNYGWVSIKYTGTNLEIMDSATARGGGIIVGQYTQIPEPSTVLLVLFGTMGLYRRMRSDQLLRFQHGPHYSQSDCEGGIQEPKHSIHMKSNGFISVAVIGMSFASAACCRADLITSNAYYLVSGPGDPVYDWSALLVAPTIVDRQSGFSVLRGKVGNADYEFGPGLAASAYGLFPAVPGQEFTPPDVYDWPSALGPGYNPVSFGTGETKYFAFWADVWGTAVDVPDDGDDFGWVSLTYTGTDLVVSDSATALGGGIIVGTHVQIPEPSTVLLVALGGIALYRRMRWR